MKRIVFFANNNIGTGQSGGDTIFLNFLKHWKKLHITVFGSTETQQLLNRYNLKTNFILTDHRSFLPLPFHIFRRTIKGLISLFVHRHLIYQADYIYSVSDFYPDSLPPLLVKIIHPKITWLAGFYLMAPPPFASNNPYQGRDRIKGISYYLFQRLSYFFINRFADYILITSQPDIKYFLTPQRNFSKIIVVQGGVDPLPKINLQTSPIYDACFIGRLHPQKGVLLLPSIWQRVLQSKPNAKLAVIGDGPLQSQLQSLIHQFKLKSHIKLLGFLSGSAKNAIFRRSRIIIHPAVYDSGGMAAAEAMAFGLPGVSFDLDSLKTYYPQGMIKTPCFDIAKFAINILKLLDDSKLHQQMSRQASNLIKTRWYWPQQSTRIYNQIFHE